MKIKIKKIEKEHNKFDVSMKLTHGAILTIRNALEQYNSAISQDILGFMDRAMQESKIN